MAQNIIDKLLKGQVLLAIGFLLAFVDQAAYVPAVISSFLAPFAGFGYLLIVVAALMALWSVFKK